LEEGWTKKQRRVLRDLQGLALERELSSALGELREDFQSWEDGEISPFELNDRIHRFHNGRSRELFNTFGGGPYSFWIANVIARGIIKESEVSEDILAELRADIDMYRERLHQAEESTGEDE
jgi:hypothetical protein